MYQPTPLFWFSWGDTKKTKQKGAKLLVQQMMDDMSMWQLTSSLESDKGSARARPQRQKAAGNDQ